MKVRALVIRILRQLLHDKRTLALMLIAPLLILTLVSLVFHSNSYRPKIGTVHLPTAMTQGLSKETVSLSGYPSSTAALNALRDQKIDAYVDVANDRPNVVLEGSDPSKNKVILLDLQALSPASSTPANARTSPRIEYLYGSANMSSFDNFGPVLIGFFAFFFVFLVAGISFLKERTSGTLERLVATPIKRWQIVIGYICGFGIFTTIQALLVTWFSVDVLGMMMKGQLINLLLITVFLSLTALTFGIFLSSFANSEFQMMQFIPIVIVPQVFFSGLFNLDTMVPWLRWLSKIVPLYYGADAMRNVMIRGEGFGDIATDLAVLLGLSLLFICLNVVTLRKYRKV